MTHAHSASPFSPDSLWPQLRDEAEKLTTREPLLSALAEKILAGKNAQDALIKTLVPRLSGQGVTAAALEGVFAEAAAADPGIGLSMLYDLIAIKLFDPAARDLLTPFLFFKGFHALQAYRVAHWLWNQDRQHLALYLQNRISDLFGVDIHPAATIGRGVMMDHATGIVIGETAIVEDDVLFWHGVTLGGRDMTAVDRHPKVRKGALLGANATILGAIEIGAGARIAAGSIVVEAVPANATVTGTPAKIISKH